MNQQEVQAATLDQLLAEYVKAASEHGEGSESGDHRRANAAFDVLNVVYAELRRRGPEGQRALLPLLHDKDAGVRLWAASHAPEFSPREGEVALEALKSRSGLIGFTARITLGEWHAGRLHFS